MRAMETARREAEQQATEDPNNAQAFLQWGAALLELAQVTWPLFLPHVAAN